MSGVRQLLTQENGGRPYNIVDWLKLDINNVGYQLAQWSRGEEFARETEGPKLEFRV